jgi:hypothetical protein
MDISGAEERTPSRGVLLFFPFFIAKRNPLKHKRKQHVLFGNLRFGDNEVERSSQAISPEVRSHGRLTSVPAVWRASQRAKWV